MCEVSDKLKLCSCKTKNVENLKHYWVLNRPADKGGYVLGSIMPPANIGEATEKLNQTSLRKQLNNGNCFDIELNHQENDILELHFTCTQTHMPGHVSTGDGTYLVYAFSYKKGKWRKTSYDPFGNNMDNIHGGKITAPFKNLTISPNRKVPNS